MLRGLAVALTFVIACRPVATDTPAGVPATAAALQRRIEEMAARHAGVISVYAKNLATGQTVAIRADQPMRTASVIKLLVLLAAFEKVKDGTLALGDTMPLTADNVVGGSGVLWFMKPGLPLTVEDALSLMIIVSDNTATNLVIDRVGLDAVNATAARLGLAQTRLFRKVGKFPAVPDDNEKAYGLGKISARDAATLLESIERCDLGVPALCNQMLTMMIRQQYRAMAPRYLEVSDEDRTSIANKFGQLNQTRNDVALVYSVAGPLVISVLTTDNEDARWTCENEGEQLIGHITKAVVDAWSPGGLRPGGPPQLAKLPAP